MTPAEKAELRRTLLAANPWLEADDVGPRSVDAGVCDRCASAPRLIETCGPSAFTAVCRPCLVELGDEAWCDGHRAHGAAVREWESRLPRWWGEVTVLWWVATGELTLDPRFAAHVDAVLRQPGTKDGRVDESVGGDPELAGAVDVLLAVVDEQHG